MQVLFCREGKFQFDNPPPRSLKPNELRISVHAIGVNRADILQRRGLYPAPKGVHNEILGLECSGSVIEVASNLSAVEWIGQRVMALMPGEAYASEVIVDVGCVLSIPDHVSIVEAAAIPEVFITAYDALWLQSRLMPGQTVCIHAVGSGVGDAARQLCLANGFQVYGTTRNGDKASLLSTEDCPVFQVKDGVFPPELPKVNVILDFVGAAYFKQNMKLLHVSGHLQVIGLLGGIRTEFNMATLLSKRLTIGGTTLRNRSLEEKTFLIEQFKRDVLPLFDDRSITPTVDSIYSWKDVESAHQRMLDNQNIGKIILVVE